jgi:Rieske 2Fe-2S family protein
MEDDRTVASADLAQETRTLPGRNYFDPAIFALEQERIFSRLWVCVGRADRLPDAGSYIVSQVGTESIIVLRDRAGELRAFLNVCRHRGARLCPVGQGEPPGGTEEGQGRLHATLQCPYHAWTYALDGRLIGAPNMGRDPSFDPDRYGLIPVALHVWEGLIWLNLSPDPPALADQLGVLYSRFAHYRVGELARAATITYDVRANWKLVVENFSECYHCAVVHSELAAHVPDYRAGRVTGTDGGAALLGPGVESLTMTGTTARPPLPGLRPEDRHAYYGDVYRPNVFVNLHPDYVVVHVLAPLTADHTRITCDWLFAPEIAGVPGFNPTDAVEFWDLVNRQDWRACELVQQGVTSRAYADGGVYGPDERHIRRFNDWVLQLLDQGSVPSAALACAAEGRPPATIARSPVGPVSMPPEEPLRPI